MVEVRQVGDEIVLPLEQLLHLGLVELLGLLSPLLRLLEGKLEGLDLLLVLLLGSLEDAAGLDLELIELILVLQLQLIERLVERGLGKLQLLVLLQNSLLNGCKRTKL